MGCPTVASMSTSTGGPRRRVSRPAHGRGARCGPARAGRAAAPAAAATAARTVEEKVEVPAGPGRPDTITLDTTLYLPRDDPRARGPGRARLRRHEGVGRRRRARAGRPRVRRPHVDGARLRRQRRADRAGLPGLRGRGRPRAGRPAGRQRPEVVQDGPGDPRVGVTGGLVRRGAGAAARRVRPAHRRRGPGDHVERPGQALFPNAAAAPGRCPTDTPARGAFSPDGVFKRGWAGVFFSAGLAAGRRPGRAVEGATGPAADGAAGTGRSARPPRPALPAHLRPLHPCRLRRLHRGRHHRTALPRHRGAPAPLLPRLGHGPDHRADARRAGRGGHAVRAGPGRRHRPADRRGRRHGARALVRRRARRRRRRTSACATRSATGSTTGSPGRAATRARSFGYTVASGVRTGGDTPTSRTVEAPAYPGLAGAPAVSTEPLAAGGRAAGRAGARRGQPRRDHRAAGARRRAGHRREPHRRVHRGAPRAVRRVPHRPGRRPAARRRRAAGRPHGRPGAGPARAGRRRCCSARSTRSPRTAPGRCSAAPSLPSGCAVPADGSPARVTRHAARRRRADRGGQPADGVGRHHGPGLRRHHDPRGLADRPRRRRGVRRSSCPSCPARPSPRTPCRSGRCSASPGCSPRHCSRRWRPGCGAARGAAPRRPGCRHAGTARPPTSRRRGRWRSATSPRPTAAGSARCAACRSTSSGAWCSGLLGPNGAGKTTVLRMLMGLIRPTAGTIHAFGEPVGAGAPVLARIGAFVEGPGFLPHLSGLENLRLYWAATGRPAAGGAPRRRAGDRRAGRRRCAAGWAPTARACGSGWRSPRPCSGCRSCWCWTSRRTGSTRRRSTRCARCCSATRRRGAPCWCRATCWPRWSRRARTSS